MATQEIMTDNQPVEKEIQQTENEIISLKLREYIRRGVLRHINGWITKYNVISYTNSKKAKTDENNRHGVMQLIPNKLQVLPHVFLKDIVDKDMNLAYRENPNFIYTLYLCEKRWSKITQFLYCWNIEGKYHAAAPYFVRTSRKEIDILCSNPFDITKVVLSKNPIMAISERLEQLTNTYNSKMGLDKDMYKWRRLGTDNNFAVSTNNRARMYWKVGEIDEEKVGKMVQIQELYTSEKARLQFLQH